MNYEKKDNDIELAIRRYNDQQEREYENKFAIKLVEKIVFGLVTLLLTAVCVALFSLIIK